MNVVKTAWHKEALSQFFINRKKSFLVRDVNYFAGDQCQAEMLGLSEQIQFWEEAEFL